MLTHEQRLKIYGGAERLAAADRQLDELVSSAPPLTQRQKDKLRFLLAKPSPAAPVARPAVPEPRAERPPRINSPLPPRPKAETAVKPPRGFVYVMGTPGSGLVKIGTTLHLQRRSGDIARMSPVPIEVLWSTPGGYQLERALHQRFASLRKHGEWFDFADRDAVAEVSAAAAEATTTALEEPE